MDIKHYFVVNVKKMQVVAVWGALGRVDDSAFPTKPLCYTLIHSWWVSLIGLWEIPIVLFFCTVCEECGAFWFCSFLYRWNLKNNGTCGNSWKSLLTKAWWFESGNWYCLSSIFQFPNILNFHLDPGILMEDKMYKRSKLPLFCQLRLDDV